MNFSDWIFLAVGGFLVGIVLCTGYYTVKYEPEARLGWTLIAIGGTISVAINLWVEYFRDVSGWFRSWTLVGYAVIALGLVFLLRARRRSHRE